MPWKIIMQEETMGREKVPVECKNVKMFPIEKGGIVQGFGKLKFVLLQVIVENSFGEQYKLKLSTSGGVMFPKFILQHPDTMAHPLIEVGQGKFRRKVPDVLEPKERKAGERESYDTAESFLARLSFLGPILPNTVLDLFVGRLKSM